MYCAMRNKDHHAQQKHARTIITPAQNAANIQTNPSHPFMYLQWSLYLSIPFPSVLYPPPSYNVAAASTAPATLNEALLVNRTSTGYIQVMYFAQPIWGCGCD